MARLVIVGAGGHGAVIAEAAQLCGSWEDIVFIDDKHPNTKAVIGLEVVGDSSCVPGLIAADTNFVVAIGNNQTRLDMFRKIQQAGGDLVSVVHPSAAISTSASLGAGTVVMAQAAINARTRIDVACIINTGATIDHDCRLEAAVHVSPGAHVGGGVTIGERAWVGIGASVKNNLSIGSNALVGAAAGVVKDVPADRTVVGIPAREGEVR